MTHTRNTPASPASDRPTTLPADGFTGRALRARTEPMLVRPLRDDRYVVETERGTYVVDLDGRSCTCPDHAIRGARCKHLRRVAIEVTEGRVPPPGHRRAVCAVCGDVTFVPTYERGPQLCDRHGFAPGDFVRDRETEGILVVTRVTGERADEYETAEGRPVADYETNADYGGHEPVVEAVYLESVRALGGLDTVGDAKRYGFPASRLRRVDDGPRLTAGSPDSADGQAEA
ncbi:SWIM zinc finger [Halogranum gelatinilyticum]|uniref:SWIM zinc finger n=1 Tax=Halogranum gelatinilyticum TaxID=660521 RepID=A0A1G9P7V8_9EURY|nr:SWIM zinc finger family protein [Halogranum gelatinilyticum]SDL94866.1 SWIM zinc finger [Halogranum gelatinilyticum]